MSIHRSRFLSCLLTGLLLLGASTAAGQVRIPTENTLEDLQLFAPVESNAMSDRPYLKEGLFFNHDYLVWSVQRPRAAILGDPGRTRFVFEVATFRNFIETNSIDTGLFTDLLHDGNRTEIGYLNDCGGWMVGYTSLHDRTHRFAETHAPVILNDPQAITRGSFVTVRNPNILNLPFEPVQFDRDIDGDGNYGRFGRDTGNIQDPDGPGGIVAPALYAAGVTVFVQTTDPAAPLVPVIIPVTGQLNGIPDTHPLGTATPDLDDVVALDPDFDDIVVTNTTDYWHLEAMMMRRLDRISFKGHWELFAGVRYNHFGEEFHVEATGGILDQSAWNNESYNRIIGPQLGVRWFRDCCRWRFAIEGRFAPSVNFQSVRLTSTFGDQFDPQSSFVFQNSGVSTLHAYDFSPVAELRLNYSYQVTRAISLRAGYTAQYIGTLARPSNMILYNAPNLMLMQDNYHDDTFMQGINVGFEVNR